MNIGMLNEIMSKLVIKNVKTGQPSYILTAFISGIFIVNTKLLLSGLQIVDVKMSDFSGVDYAAAIAALGGIYTLNKQVTRSKEEKKEE
jgi:hypothetical protein